MVLIRTSRLILSAIPALLILIALGVTINTANAALMTRANPGELIELSTPVDLICPADMIAFWQLEELGGPYLDSFGDHDGAHTGNPPDKVLGMFGNAQDFKGTTTGIDVPSDTDFDWVVTDSFSIEFWVKPNVDACENHSRVVIGRDDGTSVGWWVGCQIGGAATFQLDDSNNITKTVTGVNISDGLWHHLVAVRDGTSNTNYLYVDNVQNSIVADTYTGDFIAVAPANINIGWIDHRIDPPEIHRFAGVIDEVAIYNRALTALEVAEHYSGSAGETAQPYCVEAPTDIFLPVVSK